MNSNSFTYHGKEYQVDKVAELNPGTDNKYIQIVTKDNQRFKLTFKESVYRWVLTKSTD